jgi:hypothetical protein
VLMHVTGGGNTCGGMLWQIQDIVQDVSGGHIQDIVQDVVLHEFFFKLLLNWSLFLFYYFLLNIVVLLFVYFSC